jgi:LssY C-terminus
MVRDRDRVAPARAAGFFMSGQLRIAILILGLGSAAGFCQTTSTSSPSEAKQYSFTLSAAGKWTDTNLDLQKGEEVHISPATAGCANQDSTSSAQQSLPLASAPAGSLIARLSATATPITVNTKGEIEILEPSHLYLGLNGKCPTDATVTVQVSELSQADKLKQQLGNAAQIWLQGQFGNDAGEAAGKLLGNSAASAPATTTPLKVSNAPLDPRLQKDINSLPRRVNDQFKNLGDMVNFVLIGSESDVKSALAAANWHIADTSNVGAVVAAINNTYQKEDYLAMPMSTLYLFGRPQDYGYEMAEPIAMVASRNHFRLWKAPFTWNGQTLWAGAGTHDIGFAKDKRNGSITHKVDPNLDGERTNIGQSLEATGKVQSISYYLPTNPVTGAKVATGDSYTSDGRILVVFLK